VRVVDLLNALQRFPGKAEVSCSDLTADGVSVVVSGKQVFTPTKGTKGYGGNARVAAAVPVKSKSKRK